VGLYGVMSYAVARRTREFGVRLALGARPAQLLTDVLARAAALTAAGLGAGLVGAAAVSRLLSGLLFGVKPSDPATFVTVSLLLTGVALLASYLAARRATRVEPLAALRYD
jgi:putative ABC transport system permease protein